MWEEMGNHSLLGIYNSMRRTHTEAGILMLLAFLIVVSEFLWSFSFVFFFPLAEPPARPVVYPLVPCCDTFTESLKGDMTFACLVTGYFPVPVDITWDISKGMQNVTQNFPPMKSSNGHLTSSSQLSILGTNVNGNRFQCNVAHNPTNTKTSKIVPTGERRWMRKV